MYKNQILPLVSVIILNYNGKEVIKRCLESALKADYRNFELIFVDNASTDGSVKLAKELFGSDSRLRIICNNKNLGFTGGNNVGAIAAKGKYIIFLNNDTEVDPYWLKELMSVFELDHTIGACQCKLLFMDGRMQIDSTGGFINCLGLCEERGKMERDEGQYDQIDEIFHAKGAAIAIKKSVLDEIGFFDQSFFINYEDVDLCWRIWLRGYRVVFCPKSIVYHKSGFVTKKQKHMFHSAKNCIRMLMKNYSKMNLLRYLPILIFLELGASLILAIKRKCDTSLAIIKAIFWNLKYLKETLKERGKVQQFMRKMPDGYVMKRMRSIRINLSRPQFK